MHSSVQTAWQCTQSVHILFWMLFFTHCLSLFILSNMLHANLTLWITLYFLDVSETLLLEIVNNYLASWCCSDVCNWHTIIFCHLILTQTESNILLMILMILWIFAWDSCLHILRLLKADLHSCCIMTFMWTSSQIEVLFHDFRVHTSINISLANSWSYMLHW